MVVRFCAILSIMGIYVRPLDVFSTPDFGTTSTFHRSLFWLYRSHSLLFTGRKSQAHLKHVYHLLTGSESQLRSSLLTLTSAIFQLICLLWYLVSYFPMGSSGLRMATSFGA